MNIEKVTQRLMARKNGPKLTMVVPMHPKSRSQSMEEDRIRLKNALTEIQTDASTHDHDLQDSLHKIESKLDDTDFLRNQSKTLVVYADRDMVEYVRLDNEFSEFAHFGDEFILTPLLMSGSLGASMYVLHCSLDNPQLYLYSEDELQPVEEMVMPDSLADALNIDEYVKEKQHHVGTAGGGGIHHGHGATDNKTVDIEVYLSRLANELNEYFTGKSLPLLLVGAEERVAFMRQHLNYDHLLPQSLEGNYQHVNIDELHRDLRELKQEIIDEDLQRREEHVLSLEDDMTITEPETIESASERGQVDSLLVPIIRRTQDSVRAGMGTEPVFDMNSLNLSVVEKLIHSVLRQGGKVQAVTQDAFGTAQQLATLRFKVAS